MEDSPVRFWLRAPKIGKSSSGKTAVSEAVNLGSIPGFPAMPEWWNGRHTGLRNQRESMRVRISPWAPKFNVGKSSSGKTAAFDSANLGSIPGFPAKI